MTKNNGGDISVYCLMKVYLCFSVRACVLPSVMSLVLIEASIVLMLVFLRKRVCIAIALLKEGSK